MDTGIQNILENQDMSDLNTYKDKNYPSALVFLGVIAFLSLIALIFCFSLNHWVLGIIFSIVTLVLVFTVVFFTKKRSLSFKEEKNK